MPLAGGDGIVWAGAKDTDPSIVAAARETALKAQANEYRRLLYVAMTRAERRLVICGTSRPLKQDGTPSIPDECWYRLIADALVDGDAGLTIEADAEDGEGQDLPLSEVRARDQMWQRQPRRGPEITEAPDWLHKPVTADPVRAVAISPSRCRRNRHAGAPAESSNANRRWSAAG